MSVEEYSLKFTMLSRYAPSLMSNAMNEMSRFVTGVATLGKKSVVRPCSTRTWTCVGLWCMVNPLNRGGSSELNQPRFNKRAPMQDWPSAPKVKLEKESVSQNGKPTFPTCGKKNYVKSQVGRKNCFCFGMEEHKVKDCASISTIKVRRFLKVFQL